MFEEFRESPSTWRPSVVQRDRRTKTPTANEHAPTQSNEADDRSPAVATSGLGSVHDSLVSYPFPLRESVLAMLHLPPDLSQREARRLADFIGALAIDEPTTDSAATRTDTQ